MPPERKAQKNNSLGKDCSKSLSVRMTEEQRQRLRLRRYMALTRLNSTAYLCRLIQGGDLRGRFPKLNHAMHAGVNMIYSNVLQISRHQRAREMDAEAVETLVFLTDKLCEEIYLLSTQK